MVPVNTVLGIAVLPERAGIQPRQPSNRIEFITRGPVIVHKRAAITLGARPAEEVVVAELVAVLALLDRV